MKTTKKNRFKSVPVTNLEIFYIAVVAITLLGCCTGNPIVLAIIGVVASTIYLVFFKKSPNKEESAK